MEDFIEIIPFDQSLAKHFTELNLAWIEKYFEVEESDKQVLGNPGEYIIDKGGHIFFAKLNNEIVGTFALIKEDNEEYELSKMAVAEEAQGKHVGNKLLEFCLDKAKDLKAKKIVLFSNSKLLPAIHLYKKYGFKEVPIGNSIYKRSDIKMEIDIN